jgi:hypothetical protein
VDTTNQTGLGSLSHVRATLERARAAIRASKLQTEHSRALLARSGRLAAASDRVLQESLALREQLRASVTAYVRHLKADGLPAERVLVFVKSAVREGAAPELDPAEVRALMEDVVRWSVEAYYPAA